MYPILDGGISGASSNRRRNEPITACAEMASDLRGEIIRRDAPYGCGAGDRAEPERQPRRISDEVGLYRQDAADERPDGDGGGKADLQRGLAEAPLHRPCFMVFRVGSSHQQRWQEAYRRKVHDTVQRSYSNLALRSVPD